MQRIARVYSQDYLTVAIEHVRDSRIAVPHHFHKYPHNEMMIEGRVHTSQPKMTQAALELIPKSSPC